MGDFDRNKRASELAEQYKIPGRLAWMAADPNPDTEKANLQALLEGGVTPLGDKEDKRRQRDIDSLMGQYQSAKAVGNTSLMIAAKFRLAGLGVFFN